MDDEKLLILGHQVGDNTLSIETILPHQLTEQEKEQALKLLEALQPSSTQRVVVTDEGLLLPVI